ncbi:MAG: NAD(P)H-hydrate dehydratase [Acidobacteria bacterium]|jgi:NAD(P)H-hydrate epimerase|nr:NAD(P)H-hydrate dehydratase [Bryobacteraceae bacterium CoA2 C42]
MTRVLTAAEMRAIDARTIAAGLPELVLMENAAHRVVEVLEREFAPLGKQRIVIFAGKGNNGGDGLAIARLLHSRFAPPALDVVLTGEPQHPQAALLRASGFTAIHATIPERARRATLVIDALLGTGLTGPAREPYAAAIAEINTGFPLARVVAVDLPSGMDADTGRAAGAVVRADFSVTFTAPKRAHLLGHGLGRVTVAPIGTPEAMLAEIALLRNEPNGWRHLLAPRPVEGHKGTFGHVLAIGGAAGKAGAIGMTGLAALRMGAGLVTVATSAPVLPAPELMTTPLAGDWPLAGKDSVALGPGLGADPRVAGLVRDCPLPLVVDADGLNALAGALPAACAGPRVFTPHPGEMARLLGRPVDERLADARALAAATGAIVVLKGHRTVIATPGGLAALNPTGTPAMATAGSGDILTGLLAALLATAPPWEATLAAVYLHGLAGELAAAALTERCVIATDLLAYLPEAIRRCA